MPSTIQLPQIRHVPKGTPAEEIISIIQADGGVIIEGFLSKDQVQRFNMDIDPALQKLQAGSTHADESIATFHGSNTKRLTDLVTRSKFFREEILDHDDVHAIAEKVYMEESGSYWMTTAQVIEIGPGNDAQRLHRDLENFYPFVTMGPSGPEVTINYIIALTDFTEENGATRVIPGSNHWPDFNDRGEPEMTIPAEMNAGDVILISGKVVHGGGANKTTNERRRGLAFTFQPGFLTPEEAYPFLVSKELAKTMSTRAQKMLGFRSQYPKGSPGLWQCDYNEIAGYIGL